MPELRQPEEEEEDLDEDRRVPDHLDVDRGELADDRDAVGARGAEDEPDQERADDRDRRDLQRAHERRRAARRQFSVTNDPGRSVTREDHQRSRQQERPRRARPLLRSSTPCRLRAHRRRASRPARSRTCRSAAGCSSRTRDEPAPGRCSQDRHEAVLLAHQLEPRVDPALHRGVALLDADPVRRARGTCRSSASSSVGRRRSPTRTVSSHISASARPWLNASSAFVKLSVDDQLRVREAALDPAVVDRAATSSRSSCPAMSLSVLDRRVVLDEQAARSPCSTPARSRSACRGRRVGERRDDEVGAVGREQRLAGRRRCADEGDAVRAAERVAREPAGDLDVEAGVAGRGRRCSRTAARRT